MKMARPVLIFHFSAARKIVQRPLTASNIGWPSRALFIAFAAAISFVRETLPPERFPDARSDRLLR